jgi:hypothetical protein
MKKNHQRGKSWAKSQGKRSQRPTWMPKKWIPKRGFKK